MSNQKLPPVPVTVNDIMLIQFLERLRKEIEDIKSRLDTPES